jgi:biofilm PGA synthesis lipoprotein PgaB
MRRVALLPLLPLLLSLSLTAVAQSADVTVLCYHDVRDSVGAAPLRTARASRLEIFPDTAQLDPDQYAISVRNLVSEFDWLRARGYHVVSLQQLIDARTGRKKLPDHAVLLTFDDGLQSVYSKVFPLLKAYQYPAVVSVVGAWADLSANGKVNYGFREFTRADFATWPELREMQASGLVEIASHTWNMHRGILANPQGNLIPAVSTHAYDPKLRHYETDAEYATRIQKDLARSSREIEARLGRAPRAIMWPYGAYTLPAEVIANSLGMSVSFTLGYPVTFPGSHFGDAGLRGIPRLVLVSNPSIGDFVWSLQHLDLSSNIRAIQVDLDYVYDPDPAQEERNLSALLDRVKKIRATQVWLQAFADPQGTGAPASVYFPNHELPMRADLFSRVAWQLRTRCDVQVYAWMPVLAWQLPDKDLQAHLEIRPKAGVTPEAPVRLNPFLPETRKIVGDIYEDLGRSTPVAGILFSDDAVLRDTDELGPGAPPPGPERTQALIQFTNEMANHVRHWSPELSTARNLFAEPVLHPAAESWYAQSLPAFLSSYNVVALMAMPQLENARRPKTWLSRLVRTAAAVPGANRKTVYELQSTDWRTKRPIPTGLFTKEMSLVVERGGVHLAYYPDDFDKNVPELKRLIPVFSASPYPAPQP